ncbi:MAG: MIP/aquaporin family protein [Candidatus Baldrarchaeia archaeon]
MGEEYPLTTRCLAELLGTYILVFIGPGSVITFSSTLGFESPAAALFGIGFSFAIAVAVAIYVTGHISGTHINPAVTISLAAIKRFPIKEVIPYIVCQLIGAVLASATHLAIYGKDVCQKVYFGLTLPGDIIGNNAAIACLNEMVMTFILMFTIMGVAVSGKAPEGWAGWTIGLVVGALIWWGGPISGTSLNPARTFGPAVLSGNWTAHWVYWVGPIVGAVIAAFVYEYLFIKIKEGKATE